MEEALDFLMAHAGHNYNNRLDVPGGLQDVSKYRPTPDSECRTYSS